MSSVRHAFNFTNFRTHKWPIGALWLKKYTVYILYLFLRAFICAFGILISFKVRNCFVICVLHYVINNPESCIQKKRRAFILFLHIKPSTKNERLEWLHLESPCIAYMCCDHRQLVSLCRARGTYNTQDMYIWGTSNSIRVKKGMHKTTRREVNVAVRQFLNTHPNPNVKIKKCPSKQLNKRWKQPQLYQWYRTQFWNSFGFFRLRILKYLFRYYLELFCNSFHYSG